MPVVSARKKCICQLCTCGRHMCPHRKQNIVLGTDSADKASNRLAIREEKRKQRKQWELPNGKPQDISLSADQASEQQVLSETNVVAVTVQDKGNSAVPRAANDSNGWSSKQVPKTLPIKRPDNLRSEGYADFTTIHQQDFKGKSSELLRSSEQTSVHTSEDIRKESWNQRQIPKTQKIKKPDTLTLSGPLNLETTHKAEFNEAIFHSNTAEDKLETTVQKEVPKRPRTSLKLSGEFQSNSSYQQAFTPKRVDDGFKVKKGTSMSHLKPEGEMSFDTTSLDYNATLKALASNESDIGERIAAVKTKPVRPPSGIKIPEVPLSDETTAVTDYRRWNVEKPTRYKPSDTLQLRDGSEMDAPMFDTRTYKEGSLKTEKSDERSQQISKSVTQKPQNHLKPEGSMDFTTTNDIDYTTKKRDRSRALQSNLETVSEHVEKEAKSMQTYEDQDPRLGAETEVGKNMTEDTNTGEERKMPESRPAAIQPEEAEHVVSETTAPTIANSADHDDYTEVNKEQQQYTWDQIRPKPIRPQSNLRQEGGMEFNTTNRSEFVERTMDRVKGIRPKTTTKLAEGEFDATTMNKIMFSHDQGERAIPIRPKNNLHLEGGDFTDETTSAREFQPWQVKRPSPIVPKPSLAQQGSIDFTTTNNTEFEEKRPEKVYPIRPTTTNRISGELDLATTSQIMHPQFPIERVQKIVPQSTLRMNSGNFESETTSKRQFQQWGIERPKPIKPESNLRQEGSMDFTTMNQLQFEEKPIEKVSQIRPHTSSKITGEFDGTTTNQVMYANPLIQRPRMVKPKGNLEVEQGTFATDTTNQAEYRHWEPAKPNAITPRNNLQQEGSMDFTTTNKMQYATKTVERVSEIRPKTNSKITGKFDDTTTNKKMFRNIPGERRHYIRPQTNIKLEKGNFMNQTTSNRDFQTWEYAKPTPIKPHSSIRQEGEQDFTTMNKTQFEGKPTEKVTQIRPITTTELSGEFEGTTTNQVMFQSHPIETVRGKRPSTNIHVEKGKFDDQTTARREFQQWDFSRPEAIKPLGNLSQEGTMDFTTSNQTEFGEKPISKTEQIRPHTSSPVTGDFDGTTTNQIMFQAQPMERVHDIRPRDNLRVEGGHFKGETTTSKEYGYKAGSKAESIKPKTHLSQEGEFDFTTSNQTEFEEKPISKVSQIRPKTLTRASSDGKLYSTTTNQATYKAPAMETVHEIRPKSNIHLDEGQFQSSTTTADEYRPWQLEKPKAFQLASALKQEGDMQFETTNSSEFRERGFDRVQQIRPKTTTKMEGDFDATTTNQTMFQQHEKLERVKPIRHQNNLQLETGRFSDETTTNREFRQWVKVENKKAEPKKKTAAAGIRSQKERPNRRKEISKDSTARSLAKEEEHEHWKVNRDDQIVQASDTERSQPTTEHSEEETLIEKGGESAKYSPEQDEKGNTMMPAESEVAALVKKQDASRDTSTTMADYGVKRSTKVKSIKPTEHLIPEGDMTFSTTSQTDFEKPDITREKESTFIKSQDVSEKESGKKISETNGYEAWKLNEKQRAMNLTAKSEKEELTEGQKSTQSNGQPSREREKYRLSETAPGGKVPKRFRPRDNLKFDPVPFDGTSTTRTEYKKWEAKRSSSKRRGETLKQEGKMEFDTTSNDYSKTDYEINRDATKARSKADQKGSLGQTGNMEFSTTSKMAFTGENATKAKNLRPRSSFRLGDDDGSRYYEPSPSSRSNPEMTTREHDLTSTSRASYVGYTTTRTRANRPSTSQKVGQGPFDGQSTTRSSFIQPHNHIEKPRLIKPENHNILDAGNGFSGDTTYRSSFETAKDHCPVLDLQAGRSPFTFNEEKNGHLYYAPRVQG